MPDSAHIAAIPTSALRRSGLSAPAAALYAFTASCATLVLELIAGRLLSPFVGSSLYTWTSIIGIVLAGISIGNWLGGRLADRNPSRRTVGMLFIAGAVAGVWSIAFAALLGDGSAARGLDLLPRIFVLTFVAFFPASFVLGMITPIVIRLLLSDVRQTGRVVGLVYALGTLGSLAGNFLTGFVLVAYFTVASIVLITSAILLLLGIVSGRWWSRVVWRGNPEGDDAAQTPRENRSRPPSVGEDTGSRSGLPPKSEAAAFAFEPLGDVSQRPDEVANSDASANNPDSLPRPAETRGSLSADSSGRPLEHDRGRFDLTGNVALACLIVVVASFCSMVVELNASRILAPIIGVSLYSWTGIIGVVLAGISIGNYLGGWIADRWAQQRILGATLFLAGIAIFSILVAFQLMTGPGAPTPSGLMERIVVLTAGVFFLPVLVIGTVSPQVIKLAVVNVEHAGRISGRVYAWSTAGAIIGTFAAGWYLIAAVGVNRLTFFVGLAMILTGIIVGRFWRSAVAVAGVLAVSGAAIYGLNSRDALASPCTLETSYFCIRVHDDTFQGRPVKALILDHLIHSYVDVSDPSFLGYSHEQIQAEFARVAAAQHANPRVMVIGGGGYTYPRWVDRYVPAAAIDVVEIDPGVTATAFTHLGLWSDTRIASHNLDGRQFVQEFAPKGSYDLFVQDAVNDLSVPYHLMTKEYNDSVRDVLSDDGVYLLTVIDLYQDGQLMRSAARTMRQTFPEVQLLGATPIWNFPGASVFVIAGSRSPIDLDGMRATLAAQGLEMRTIAQPQSDFDAYLAQGPQIILTDEYSPVDNLISILFERR